MTTTPTPTALVAELAAIRERGVLRIESPNPRLRNLALPVMRELADRCAPQVRGGFPLQVTYLISRAINFLPDEHRVVALELFGIDTREPLSTPDKWRKNALEVYERLVRRSRRDLPLSSSATIDDFRKGIELEIIGLLAASMIGDYKEQQVKEQPALRAGTRAVSDPIDHILTARSTVHVVRTLEDRLMNAKKSDSSQLQFAITKFQNWHVSQTGSSKTIVAALDHASRNYIGRPLAELLGLIESDIPGPEDSPHEHLSWLEEYYPPGEAMRLVAGALEPLTGQAVEPFYISAFPVTAFEWYTFLKKFDWPPSKTWAESTFGQSAGWLLDEFLRAMPAVGMTYYDCVAYCFWLRLTTPYAFRLPTESEWNLAANAGERVRFPWGNDVDVALGHYSTSKHGGSMIPVHMLPGAGHHGLAGLSGNVWEYTSSLWLGDSPRRNQDVAMPDLAFALGNEAWWRADQRFSRLSNWRDQVKVVMKGGSYGSGPEYGTVDSRIYSSFWNYGEYGGFRLAVSSTSDSEYGFTAITPSPFVSQHVQSVRLVPTGQKLSKSQRPIGIGGGCGGSVVVTEGEVVSAIAEAHRTHWADILKEVRRPGS